MQLKTPNIRHLRAFLEVTQSKSISRASKKIFLSQPAITQAIAKLEKNLNTKLFDRRSDGMYLTASGQAYAYRIERALNIILDGTKAAIRNGDADNQNLVKHSLQMLTTTQLRALIAVNETQNFSLAGRNIGVSQSSLHRAARDLENQLGVVFFEKTRTGIRTSKAAQILAKASKLAFSEMSQGQEEVNSLHNREVGHIVVGCMPLARTSILPNAINQFSKQYPDFNFNIADGSYHDLLNHLRHGDFDLLIGALRFPVPCDDVIQEKLLSSTICIVARNHHPLQHQTDICADILANYPWVVPSANTPTNGIFRTIFNNCEASLPARLIETSSQILMRGLLVNSDRLAIISEEQVQHELSNGVLVKIPFEITFGSRPIGITMRKSWKPTKTQLFFLDMLRSRQLVK